MQKQDIVGYRTPLDAARRYKLEKVKVLKVAEDGSVAEVMLKGDAKDGSKITLKADQIDLKGKNINLTGDDVTISSTNFNVDSNGNMTCSNANVSGTITSSNATITGGSFSVGSKFSVSNTGVLNCSGATISGTVTASSGTIGGWTINSDKLSNGVYFVGSNGYGNIYTYVDIVIIRNYLLGNISFTQEDISHYDLNNDGVVDSAELLILRQMILGIDQ